MESLLIHNARLFNPFGELHPGWLLVVGGKIGDLGAGNHPMGVTSQANEQINAAGKALLLGFIDLHVHGTAGQDVMDANPQGADPGWRGAPAGWYPGG